MEAVKRLYAEAGGERRKVLLARAPARARSRQSVASPRLPCARGGAFLAWLGEQK